MRKTSSQNLFCYCAASRSHRNYRRRVNFGEKIIRNIFPAERDLRRDSKRKLNTAHLLGFLSSGCELFRAESGNIPRRRYTNVRRGGKSADEGRRQHQLYELRQHVWKNILENEINFWPTRRRLKCSEIGEKKQGHGAILISRRWVLVETTTVICRNTHRRRCLG